MIRSHIKNSKLAVACLFYKQEKANEQNRRVSKPLMFNAVLAGTVTYR